MTLSYEKQLIQIIWSVSIYICWIRLETAAINLLINSVVLPPLLEISLQNEVNNLHTLISL